MKSNILFSLIVTVLHLSLPTQCIAWFNTWPQLDTPVGVNTQWIAKEIQHNGIDMQILQLEGSIPAEQTLRFYQHLWETSKAKYKVFSVNNQIVISTVIHQFNGDYQLTLELKANKNYTQGILSSMRLNNSQHHPAAALNPHLPHESRIISDTRTLDLNNTNRVIVATNSISLSQSRFHFQSILTEQGWQEEVIQQQDNKLANHKILLRFFKEQDELTISLFAEQGTKIVAVYVHRM